MDPDPYAVRADAPISIVKSAKASLRDPTRPQTPCSDLNRQLFSRDSEFAQNRPPSAYGVPGSKLFFENGPKLSIARLDPYARPEGGGGGGPGALGFKRGSILESGPAGNVHDSWRSPGGRSLIRSSSSQAERDSGERLLQHQASGGRPTVSETVQALKANLAAAELGYRSPHNVCDLDGTPGDSPWSPSSGQRPGSAQVGTGPLEGLTRGLSSRQSGGLGPQVLEITQYSDSSDSEDDYDHYEIDHGPDEQPSKGERQRSVQGPMILDPSDAFMQWRSETEGALQQLADATAALAAVMSSSQGSGTAATSGTGRPAAGARQEAMAAVLSACSKVLACVVAMRSQPHSSQWLNSSSDNYIDGQGNALTVREAVTEHVYRLMDSQSPELLLRACSVMLRVVKRRGPLLQAAKLLYRLSKDSSHDTLFRREVLLEPILRTIHVLVSSASKSAQSAHPAAQHPSQRTQQCSQGQQHQQQLYEPLVYYCGVLKNISNDPHNQRHLVRLGAVSVLCSALSSMVEHTIQHRASQGQQHTQASGAASSSGPSPEQVAVQVTGVLRNLAVAPAHAPAFLSAKALSTLKQAMSQLGSTQELALNLGRVLSKLSLVEQFQAVFESDTEYAPLLVHMLGQYQAHGPMMLRLAFVLGNLTTHSDPYRMQVAQAPSALDLVASTLQHYTDGTYTGAATLAAGTAHQTTPTKRPAGAHAASREDCIVKLLRLVANLAIHPKVGPGLAARAPLAQCLLSLLESHEYAGDSEELVLNAVCAVTNLSFYQSPDNQVLLLEPGRLMRPITPLLLSDNEEAVVESARAFGNLSRSSAAREYLVSARVLEALVVLLDHSSSEVLYSVCGTLINFSADTSRQAALVQLGAVDKLVDVLLRCADAEYPADTQVSTLCAVCKVLFNLCAEGAKASGLLDHDLSPLASALEAIQQAEEWRSYPEVSQVTARLSTLVSRLKPAH